MIYKKIDNSNFKNISISNSSSSIKRNNNYSQKPKNIDIVNSKSINMINRNNSTPNYKINNKNLENKFYNNKSNYLIQNNFSSPKMIYNSINNSNNNISEKINDNYINNKYYYELGNRIKNNMGYNKEGNNINNNESYINIENPNIKSLNLNRKFNNGRFNKEEPYNKLSNEEIKSIFSKNKEKKNNFNYKNSNDNNNNKFYISKNNSMTFQNIKRKIDSASQTSLLNSHESMNNAYKTIPVNKDINNNLFNFFTKKIPKNISLNNIYSRNPSNELSNILTTSKLIKEISKSNEKLKKEIEKLSPNNDQKFKEDNNTSYSYKYKFNEEPFYSPSQLNNIQTHQKKLSYNNFDYKRILKLPKNMNNNYRLMVKNQSEKYINKPNQFLSNSRRQLYYNSKDSKGVIENSPRDNYYNNYSENEYLNKPKITYELKNKRNNSYSSNNLNDNNLFKNNYRFDNNFQLNIKNNELINSKKNLLDVSYCNLCKQYHHNCNICNGCFGCYCKCGLSYNYNNHQNNSQLYPKCYCRENNF